MIYCIHMAFFSSHNVKMLVFQVGAYEVTKYFWIGRRLAY